MMRKSHHCFLQAKLLGCAVAVVVLAAVLVAVAVAVLVVLVLGSAVVTAVLAVAAVAGEQPLRSTASWPASTVA